jgi:hypothetical protein
LAKERGYTFSYVRESTARGELSTFQIPANPGASPAEIDDRKEGSD